MSTSTTLPPLPDLKSFGLTHILYNPSHPPYLSLPLTLLSLSPIFLFVSYFTLVIFDRRLVVLNLALGSIANELLSWGLKRVWKGDRPYVGLGGVGDGYGMPSSHAQAAGFLLSWGVGYILTVDRRRAADGRSTDCAETKVVRRIRVGIYMFGLVLWSLLTAYSRYTMVPPLRGIC
jgi:dolichyldiphosphatase